MSMMILKGAAMLGSVIVSPPPNKYRRLSLAIETQSALAKGACRLRSITKACTEQVYNGGRGEDSPKQEWANFVFNVSSA